MGDRDVAASIREALHPGDRHGERRGHFTGIEALRAEDLEIHYLKSHAWSHVADPVASAMDTAFALCHTTYMYCTHADCFIRRGDWLEWLVSRCGEIHPAVGYQMSDRSRHTRDWEWMVSHTATMLHMPTMLRVGACWSLQKYHAMKAVFPVDNPDWLDTETGFNWTLRRAGILPLLLASEVNFERQTDENIDHVRSYPSATLYQVGTPEYRASRETWMETAIQEAKERVRAWSQAPAPRFRRVVTRRRADPWGPLGRRRPPARPRAGG